MAVRRELTQRALESFPRLMGVLNRLTEEEVFFCLDLESRTLRRRSLIDRLISRAVRLKEISFTRQLKEQFHGTPQERLEDDPRRIQGREG